MKNHASLILALLAATICSSLYAQIPEEILFPTNRKSKMGEHYICEGPWGTIRYQTFFISPPIDYIDEKVFEHENAWYLDNLTEADWKRVVQESPLPEDKKQYLIGLGRTEEWPHVRLEPNPEFILSMSPSERKYFYQILADNPVSAHSPYCDPVVVGTNDVDKWLNQADLEEDVTSILKKLLYFDEGTAFFSDWAAMQPYLKTESSRMTFYRLLLSQKTSMPVLSITPNSNFDELSAYWSRGVAKRNTIALLQDMRNRKSNVDIDLVHILPPFARKRVNTFPNPYLDEDYMTQNCHWSSMSFYKFKEELRFIGAGYAMEYLNANFTPVKSPPLAFGDLVQFITKDDKIVHSAIYIAGDLFFSKNGFSELSPWVLVPFSDMIATYHYVKPLNLRVLRKKHASLV